MSYKKHLMPSDISLSAAYEATAVDFDTDTISRQAAIDAMRSIKPIATLSDGDSMIRMSAADHVLSNLPPAQPKREVTRNFPTPMQELLEVTANRDYWEAQCHVYEQEIERIRGRWIPSDTDGFVCSVCRNGYRNQPTLMGKPMFGFCPVCGAKMDGEVTE